MEIVACPCHIGRILSTVEGRNMPREAAVMTVSQITLESLRRLS